MKRDIQEKTVAIRLTKSQNFIPVLLQSSAAVPLAERRALMPGAVSALLGHLQVPLVTACLEQACAACDAWPSGHWAVPDLHVVLWPEECSTPRPVAM